MIYADTDGEVIRLTANYSDNHLIKQVPGKRFDYEQKQWTLPLSWASCVTMRGIFKDQLEVKPALTEWAWREIDNRINPALIARDLEDCEGDPRLYAYQRVGVQFLKCAGSALLGDEMGVGKTLQALAAVIEQDALPCLVVCPNTVKSVWAKHIEEWFPERTVEIVRGSATKRKKAILSGADFVIINWESLRIESRVMHYGQIAVSEAEKREKSLNFVDWKSVVADEAHRAKDYKSKQTRALWYVSKKADHRYGLTGTPINNNPGDLWAVMRFVSPQDFPTKTEYVDRFCLTSWSAFGSPEIIGLNGLHRSEFDRIFNPRFLRRTKAQVLPFLPPVTRQVRWVEMDTKQAKQYEEMRTQMLVDLGESAVVAPTQLTKVTRLIQLASASITDDLGVVELVKPSCKVDALLDLAEDRAGAPTVVFAESKRLLNLCSVELHKKKIDHVMITGDVSESQRAANIERFQTGTVPFILVTLGAGGEGITLTTADTVVFLQRSWSMVKNLQAEARIHRPGQQAENVQVIDYRTSETIEERVIQAFGDKLDMLEELVQDGTNLRLLLS